MKGDHREERAYLAGEENEAGQPTKRIVMDMSSDECQLETTFEDLSSVELGQTAKGDTQIKSVKVYGAHGPCGRPGSPRGVPVAQG